MSKDLYEIIIVSKVFAEDRYARERGFDILDSKVRAYLKENGSQLVGDDQPFQVYHVDGATVLYCSETLSEKEDDQELYASKDLLIQKLAVRVSSEDEDKVNDLARRIQELSDDLSIPNQLDNYRNLPGIRYRSHSDIIFGK